MLTSPDPATDPNPRRPATSAYPQSTYRLQFHAGFTFDDASRIAPYLRDLGVTHAYASPYLTARPGSTHGYDVIDHAHINPELGGEAGLSRWAQALGDAGLGHILDTVPNHVGVGTNQNHWWNELLAHGRGSRYAGYFDVTWRGSPRTQLHDKLLLPLLGAPYAAALARGELVLHFDAEAGAFSVAYFDRRFPIDPRTYRMILRQGAGQWRAQLGADHPDYLEYRSLIRAAHMLPPACSAALEPQARSIANRLRSLAGRSAQARALIEQAVAAFNPAPGDLAAFMLLDALLVRQNYRLAFWRVAPDEINYRRFFDINDLAALRMERRDVFRATHRVIFRLIDQGIIAGLRIDHPDGLFDPKQYFDRLQARYRQGRPDAGPALYVVAEKILAPGEQLPDDWAVQGTSGYDFLNQVNGLFVDPGAEAAFTRLYESIAGSAEGFADIAYRKKKLILEISLASELRMLAHDLVRLAGADIAARDLTHSALLAGLRELVACFPVYRTYVTGAGAGPVDQRVIASAVESAVARNPRIDRSVFDFIAGAISLAGPAPAALLALRRRVAGKFQQLTAPVTAKGVEDTAFYVYNRFIALNEVGGAPDAFGVSPEALHRYFQLRQQKWPYAMSCLSTHDTKRAEDARARLATLSEIPELWAEAIGRWRRLNAGHRAGGAPDANDEYMLYQALIGAWPIEPSGAGKPTGAGEFERFIERMQAFARKALREAKVHTSWTDPNADYESAVRAFLAGILDEGASAPFLADLRALQRRVSHWGMLNSLSQTLLRIAAPGVPDTYQGSELWDFSLVDPDNRRPVDYAGRQRLLADLADAFDRAGSDRRGLAEQLIASKDDGRAKLLVTWRSLRCRRDRPGLFTAGDYIPLAVTGARSDCVFGFARRLGDQWALVVVPRWVARLAPGEGALPIGAGVWADTRLALPQNPGALRNIFTGEAASFAAQAGGCSVAVGDLLGNFPVGLLVSDRA